MTDGADEYQIVPMRYCDDQPYRDLCLEKVVCPHCNQRENGCPECGYDGYWLLGVPDAESVMRTYRSRKDKKRVVGK